MSNQGKSYTAYIVREGNTRRFLTRPTYSGRVKGVWSKQENAAIFYTRAKAQSCASNINSRRPDGSSSYFAQVITIDLQGRGTSSR